MHCMPGDRLVKLTAKHVLLWEKSSCCNVINFNACMWSPHRYNVRKDRHIKQERIANTKASLKGEFHFRFEVRGCLGRVIADL